MYGHPFFLVLSLTWNPTPGSRAALLTQKAIKAKMILGFRPPGLSVLN